LSSGKQTSRWRQKYKRFIVIMSLKNGRDKWQEKVGKALDGNIDLTPGKDEKIR
jgi:hypothetical protein